MLGLVDARDEGGGVSAFSLSRAEGCNCEFMAGLETDEGRGGARIVLDMSLTEEELPADKSRGCRMRFSVLFAFCKTVSRELKDEMRDCSPSDLLYDHETSCCRPL